MNAYYEVNAWGNILKHQKVKGARKWWGFEVRCSCPDYERRECEKMAKYDDKELIVCKHLDAALCSVIDSHATTTKEKESDAVVPGFSQYEWICRGRRGDVYGEPMLLSSKVHTDSGYFNLRWEIDGRNESYSMYAKGNLHDGRIQVYCSCPSFCNINDRNRDGELLVCKHLDVALATVVDDEY